MKCQGNHEHEPVVASLSGLYPPVLAQAFIDGLEKLSCLLLRAMNHLKFLLVKPMRM